MRYEIWVVRYEYRDGTDYDNRTKISVPKSHISLLTKLISLFGFDVVDELFYFLLVTFFTDKQDVV